MKCFVNIKSNLTFSEIKQIQLLTYLDILCFRNFTKFLNLKEKFFVTVVRIHYNHFFETIPETIIIFLF